MDDSDIDEEDNSNIPEIQSTETLIGLLNPGNYCYILSAIQSLRLILKEYFIFHTVNYEYFIAINNLINIFKESKTFKAEFEKYVDENKEELISKLDEISAKYKIKSDYHFIYNKLLNNNLKIGSALLLKEIIDNIEIKEIDEKSNKIINTINFIKVFSICVRENGMEYICNGEQNDSNEFIIILLDYLNDCVSKGKNCILDNKSIMDYNDSDLDKIKLNERIRIQVQRYYYNLYSKEYSYFSESTNSLILTIIKCVNCGFRQSSINTINILCCPIADDTTSLKESMDEYFKEDEIEYRCDKCKEKNNNIMLKKLLDLKKYMLITLKKFDYNPEIGRISKKHNAISYPQSIDVTSYTLSKNIINYKLISVINHKGMLNYGHYYSFTNYKDRWFLCNDERVMPLDINQHEKNNAAYILVYEKDNC